ncbi:MAG: peptidoglycan DD-metalloendopeptidase family protein [Patescibacteria group bacterium]
MHILNRIIVCLLLLTALVPLGTFALVATGDRERTEDALNEALEEATAKYRYRTGLSATRSATQKKITKTKNALTNLSREKRELRLKLAALREMMQDVSNATGFMILTQERTSRLFVREQRKFIEFIRLLHLRGGGIFEHSLAGRTLLRRILRGSLGSLVAHELHRTALARAREQLIFKLEEARMANDLSIDQLHGAAGDIAEAFALHQTELTKLQQEYLDQQRTLVHAEQTVELSEAELEEIKRTVADVHSQVLRMQGELARIDARIRARAERALIEKGLLDPRPGEHSRGDIAGKPQFTWPVYGRISAGFLNAAYKKFFGVPHHGLDIATGQGTPVGSAAEGIVFLVREGGAKGYTYVLIGHRGGYATLYGHLSKVTVSGGQDVSRGQIIGLSGGTPGTNGAGLMTTGPHLHFEVIQNGVNVDPGSALP